MIKSVSLMQGTTYDRCIHHVTTDASILHRPMQAPCTVRCNSRGLKLKIKLFGEDSETEIKLQLFISEY